MLAGGIANRPTERGGGEGLFSGHDSSNILPRHNHQKYPHDGYQDSASVGGEGRNNASTRRDYAQGASVHFDDQSFANDGRPFQRSATSENGINDTLSALGCVNQEHIPNLTNRLENELTKLQNEYDSLRQTVPIPDSARQQSDQETTASDVKRIAELGVEISTLSLNQTKLDTVVGYAIELLSDIQKRVTDLRPKLNELGDERKH